MTDSTSAGGRAAGKLLSLAPYLVVAAFASAPAFVVRHPPLQDAPFHLATLRVIRSFWSSEFGFAQHFQLNFQTQYVLYYVIGALLSLLVGVKGAHVAMIAAYLGGTPLALRSFLLSLGKDPRLCLLVVPLLVNVPFVMGLLPNMLGFTFMFWALAAAVLWFEAPSIRRGVTLGVLAVTVFFMHVVPFLVLGAACFLLFPWERPRSWFRISVPLLPALAVSGWWLALSRAGREASAQKMDAAQTLDRALSNIPGWTINVFSGRSEEAGWIAVGFLAFLTYGLTLGDTEPPGRSVRRLWPLPALAFATYLCTGVTWGTIWPFSPRFLLAAFFLGIPFLRFPQGLRGWIVTGLAALAGVYSITSTCKEFRAFEQTEVADFDAALDAIPPRSKVAGLIYDPGSRVMAQRFAPFVHFVNYYQAEKGGVVHFNYASYPHWPFRYRADEPFPKDVLAIARYPFTPPRSPPRGFVEYFDYVLVRGVGFVPPPGTYRVKWAGKRWTVWQKG